MKIILNPFTLLFSLLAFSSHSFAQSGIPDTKALSLIMADSTVEQQLENHSITNIRIQSMPWTAAGKLKILEGKRFTIWVESFSEDDVHNPCVTWFGADVYILLDHSLYTLIDPLSFHRECQF